VNKKTIITIPLSLAAIYLSNNIYQNHSSNKYKSLENKSNLENKIEQVYKISKEEEERHNYISNLFHGVSEYFFPTPVEKKYPKDSLFTNVSIKEIKLSELTEKFNKKHKINVSKEDFAYYVVTHFCEEEAGQPAVALDAVVNRLALSRYSDICKNGFRIGDISKENISVDDVVKAPKQFSPYNNGFVDTLVKNAIDTDDLTNFLLFKRNKQGYIDGSIYDSFQDKNDISKKKLMELRWTMKNRVTKLWDSINYVNRHLGNLIKDPYYHSNSKEKYLDEQKTHIVSFINEDISTCDKVDDGKHAFAKLYLKYAGQIGKHVAYTLTGKGFNIINARKALKEHYSIESSNKENNKEIKNTKKDTYSSN
jgi:hypothetical protein